MKDKLLLLKSTNNKSIHDRIWWTYNYGSGQKNQISDEIAEKLSESLDSFIDEIYVKPHFIPDDFCKLFQSKSPVIKCGNDNDSKLFQS